MVNILPPDRSPDTGTQNQTPQGIRTLQPPTPLSITQESILPGVIKQRHLVPSPTQKGDLYYGGDGNSFSNISIGSTGQILTVSGGVPIWQTLTSTFGDITVTSINKVHITQPATTATLTIINNKTFTADNSITLAGVDGKTLSINKNLTLDGVDGTTLTFQGTNTYVGRTTTDTLTSKTLTKPIFQSSTGSFFTDTDAATITFSMATANYHSVTLGGSRTLAVSNVAVGDAFAIEIIQGGGSNTVTWFSGIVWDNSTVPTLTVTAGKIDVFVFKCVSAGSYRGFIAAQNMG